MTRVTRKNSGSITYEFEELQLIKNHAITASGEALIDYEWQQDDTDVGYRGGYGFSIEAIVIYSTTSSHGAVNLNNSDPLYKIIEKALIQNDWGIVEAIKEDQDYIVDEDD